MRKAVLGGSKRSRKKAVIGDNYEDWLISPDPCGSMPEKRRRGGPVQTQLTFRVVGKRGHVERSMGDGGAVA